MPCRTATVYIVRWYFVMLCLCTTDSLLDRKPLPMMVRTMQLATIDTIKDNNFIASNMCHSFTSNEYYNNNNKITATSKNTTQYLLINYYLKLGEKLPVCNWMCILVIFIMFWRSIDRCQPLLSLICITYNNSK